MLVLRQGRCYVPNPDRTQDTLSTSLTTVIPSDKQERIRQGTQLSDDEIRENRAKAERNKRLTEATEDYDPDTFFEPTPDQFAQNTQEEVLSAPEAEIEADIEGTLYKEDFEERELATEKAQYQEGIDRMKDMPDWSFRQFD